MDAQGNWKIAINVMAKLKVEMSPGEWRDARKIYMTVSIKMKTGPKDENNPHGEFSIQPKTIDISQLKIMQGDQDLPMEAMLVQSVLNMHLEDANSMLQESVFKPL